MRPVGQALLQRPGPADPRGRHHEGVGGPVPAPEEVEQPLGDLVGGGSGPGGGGAVGVRPRLDDDHTDAAPGEGVAQGGGVEGVDPVVPVVGRGAVDVGHELGLRPHEPASHRSTAAR